MNIQEGKKEYLDMQIPEELHQRMKQVIEQDKKRRQERKVIHMIKRTMASAAMQLSQRLSIRRSKRS